MIMSQLTGQGHTDELQESLELLFATKNHYNPQSELSLYFHETSEVTLRNLTL